MIMTSCDFNIYPAKLRGSLRKSLRTSLGPLVVWLLHVSVPSPGAKDAAAAGGVHVLAPLFVTSTLLPSITSAVSLSSSDSDPESAGRTAQIHGDAPPQGDGMQPPEEVPSPWSPTSAVTPVLELFPEGLLATRTRLPPRLRPLL